MTSITSWIRLEPRTRDADLLPGVEARIHDPLWALARQWQLGELEGDDAGSAITVRSRLDITRIDGIRATDEAAFRAIDLAATPLEIAAHASERDAEPTLAERIRRGHALVRALMREGVPIDEFLTRYPLSPDSEDPRLSAAMHGRVPDGEAASRALAPVLGAGDLPASFGLGTHTARASAICRAWLARQPIAYAASPTWREDRLAHAFSLRAGELDLHATHQAAPAIHWFDLDAVSSGRPSAASTLTITTMPSRVRYRGMPSRRYWELEDAAVHWPAIDAGPGDVARLLFVEFAVTFADDWLVVPVDVPVGSAARVRSVVVTDTFGERTLVRAAPLLDGIAGPWKFCQTSAPPTSEAPTVLALGEGAGLLVGPALDAATLARDDQANVYWGVERVRRAADGRPRDVSLAPPITTNADGDRYELGPTINSAFHPYLDRVDDDGPILFRTTVPGAPPAASHPVLPRQLDGASGPTHPLAIQRAAILLRSCDGRYHVTIARSTTLAAAPPLPPLAFDRVRRGT